MKKVSGCIFLFFTACSHLTAQVQVSEEPFHRLAFQNKYLRLLDVWIRPGDTSQFHIHSTPSLFTHFTNSVISTQEKNKEWMPGKNSAGRSYYNTFSEILVHRVHNADSSFFHVMDIELLQPFDTNYRHRPLPYEILYENSRAVAYQVNAQNLDKEIMRSSRPIVAVLVWGDMVLFHDQVNTDSKEFKAGQFIYIDPGSAFYFSTNSTQPVNMIIYEIK